MERQELAIDFDKCSRNVDQGWFLKVRWNCSWLEVDASGNPLPLTIPTIVGVSSFSRRSTGSWESVLCSRIEPRGSLLVRRHNHTMGEMVSTANIRLVRLPARSYLGKRTVGMDAGGTRAFYKVSACRYSSLLP